MKTGEVVDARKVKIDADAAWALLGKAKSVTAAKGKKVQRFVPGKNNREEILQQAMGPSGNLRAPAFRVKESFVIGFNAELYAEWLKGK